MYGENPKYVIVDCRGHEVAIVGDVLLDHGKLSLNVISAGFCSIPEQGSVSVWGKSVSLDATSRPEDAKIIERMLGRS
jgi:hypothetical protein